MSNETAIKHLNNSKTFWNWFGVVSGNYHIYSHAENNTNSETVSANHQRRWRHHVVTVCVARSLQTNESMCWLICTSFQRRTLISYN